MKNKKAAQRLNQAAQQASGLNTGNASNIAKQHSTTIQPVALKTSTTPTIKILKGEPKVMNKPLMLINGKAYAATWPHVQRPVTEKVINNQTIKLKTPELVNMRLLTILGEDGNCHHLGEPSFKNMGFTVALSEVPKPEKIMTGDGLIRYMNGERVDVKTLFGQLVEVIDRFMDIEQSFGNQREICELLACSFFATYFLDAFTVINFIVINGDRGSGKSQLNTLASMVTYLGQELLPVGSNASLRDLADYGATLCFDEAENLNQKKADPDKRAIFLAGSRRGSTVTLKEQTREGKWRTRFVNTFCPRIFASIEMPDAVLTSRAITLRLVRTSDKKKGNSDVRELKKWPHDCRRLVDDLWMMALANLKDLPAYEEEVNERSTLIGRRLEPWRPILAVALWLERKGLTGIWDRMNELSLRYQFEIQELERDDLSSLIIRAICRHLGCEVVRLREVSEVEGEGEFILTSQIEAQAQFIAEEMELDIDPSEITSRKIGKKLSQQRFLSRREPGTGRYGWIINIKRLTDWAESYGFLTPQNSEGVTCGTSQTSQTSQTSHGNPIRIKLNLKKR